MEPVNSILRAVKVLDILKDQGTLSYMGILKRMDVPKSTLFKILATLEDQELVNRDQETNKYRLGAKLLEWGAGAQSQLEFRKIALPFMQKLSDDLDCTVQLTVVVQEELLPVESIESKTWFWQPFKFPGFLGQTSPLHCTAAGKIALAFMDEQERERVIGDRGLSRYTKNTITSKKALLSELKKIRERGYSISNAEHDELIRAVACPVRDHSGKVIAALSVLDVVTRMKPERALHVVEPVKKMAAEISRQLGYLPNNPQISSSSRTRSSGMSGPMSGITRSQGPSSP